MQSCSSPEFIQKARTALRGRRGNDPAAARAADANLESVLRSHEGRPGSEVPVYRTVEEFAEVCSPAAPPYHTMSKLRTASGHFLRDELQFGNCHDGQTKLTLTLLEFIQGAVDSARVSGAPDAPMHLVYVGASSVAANAARIAFPGIRQTIFDPATNMMTLMPAAYRKAATIADSAATGLTPEPKILAVADFFRDDTAKRLRAQRLRPGETLLFVSDIRNDAKSGDAIASDMLAQQRWARLMKCDRYVLKFRIPFEDRQEVLEKYRRGAPATVRSDGKSMHYLGGDLVIQPYSPVGSAELRLVGQRRGNGLRSAVHDIERIEDLVFAHNHFWRGNAVFDGGVSPYDLAVERKVMAWFSSPSRQNAVMKAVDGHRFQARKRTPAECTLRNPGRPGALGKALRATCARRAKGRGRA
eukprot:jgi/Tetstr1/454284/TSEL_041203.t1